MKIIVLIIALILVFKVCDVPKKLSLLCPELQKICYEMLPANSSEKISLHSLVCGNKVTDRKYNLALQETGLIHIFVVSGSHLVIIAGFLTELSLPWFLQFLILSFFSLLTGFQWPCARSLLQILLGTFIKTQKLYLRSDQLVFLSGLVVLSLFSESVSSLSLQLSWSAALALAFIQQIRIWSSTKKVLAGAAAVYIFIFPLLLVVSTLHPLSIFWNFSLGQMVAAILFPWSILSILNPLILYFFEKAMPIFWSVLLYAQKLTAATPNFSFAPWTTPLGWLWLMFLHFFVHFFLVQHLRKHRT